MHQGYFSYTLVGLSLFFTILWCLTSCYMYFLSDFLEKRKGWRNKMEIKKRAKAAVLATFAICPY